jgi:hypothetical protein
VHNEAKLKHRSGNSVGDIIKYVTGSPFLSGEDEISILDGYLSHVIEAFDRQFQQVDKLIAERHST